MLYTVINAYVYKFIHVHYVNAHMCNMHVQTLAVINI